MTKDKLEQIEQLWQKALQLKPVERESYVNEAPVSDESIRHEVLAMLKYESQSDGFLETPALNEAAQNLAREQINSSGLELKGKRLGAYEIVSQIGAGGMGTVYLARDLNLKRAVALKVLPELFATDRNHLDRFNREAEMLAKVNHPNIATLFDYDRENGNSPRFLVMEYVPGETLSERFGRGKLTVEEITRIFSQIAEALKSAHAQNIIHRDLKPANIKITEEGAVKVLDFGLAKETKQDLTVSSVFATQRAGVLTNPESLTKAQMIIGTPGYMSPEQIRGEVAAQSADWWAFGIMLYEALTGRHPFRKPTMPETMAAVLEREPNWDALPKQTPHNLVKLVQGCLQKKAAQRISGADEVLQLLSAPSNKFTEQVVKVLSRRTALKTLAATATVILVTFGIWETNLFGAKLPAHKTLAVLAFKPQNNLEKDSALLGAGFAESLRKGLRDLSDLHVVPAEKNDAEPNDWRWLVSNAGANIILSGTIQTEGDQTSIAYSIQNAQGQKISADKVVGDNLQAAQEKVAVQVAKVLGNSLQPATQTDTLSDTEKYKRYLKALALLQGDLDEALVGKAILWLQDAGDSAPVLAALGRAYLLKSMISNEGNLVNKALTTCLLALAKDGTLPEVDLTMGQLYLETGSYDSAIKSLKKVIEKQPDNIEASVALASAYEHAKQPEEAQKTFAAVAQKNPDYWLVYQEFGGYYFERGEYLEAEKNWLHVQQLLPNGIRPKLNLGSVYLKQDKLNDALFAYQEANKLKENSPAWNGIGMVSFQQGNYVYAADAFKKATALRPDDYLYWGNLGDAYRQIPTEKNARQEAYEAAITLLNKQTELNRNSSDKDSLLAEWRAKQDGHEAEAVQLIGQALKAEPASIEAQATAVKVYHLTGQRREALLYLQKIILAGYPLEDLKRDRELAGFIKDIEVQKIILSAPKRN